MSADLLDDVVLASLFQDAPIAAALIAAGGRCLRVNRAYEALFGAGPGDAYAVLRDGVMNAPAATPLVRAALDGAAGELAMFWHVRADATRVALEVSVAPLRAADGTVRCAAVWYKDVTSTETLNAERQVLRTLFEVAPEALVVADAEAGHIVDVNARAVALFGHPRTAMLGSSHLALSWPEQLDGRAPRAGIADAVARARRGEVVELEWLYRTAADEPLPCEIRLAHLPDNERMLCRVTIVDLRARKQAEAEHARLQVLEAQNRRIVEANRLKSEFVAAMSHELRTPLNAIIGFTELLFDGSVAPDAPEAHEFLGDILTSGRHLLRLINEVLDLAKVEAGKLELRPETLILERALTEVTSLLRNQAQHKRIQIVVERDPALGEVTLDPLRFKQVLYNFLSNALKFTPEGGRVTVRAIAEPAAWFRLEVEDSGIGIAADQLGRLFGAFSQLDAGAIKAEGTGLGLALSRRIVQAMGGSVGVNSEPGKGSVFHARLPRQARAATTSP